MDPATAAILASAVAASAKGVGDYFSGRKEKKAAKMKAKETKRQTLANLMNDALEGSAEYESQGLSSRAKMGKRRSQSLQDTSDLVRGAFNI